MHGHNLGWHPTAEVQEHLKVNEQHIVPQKSAWKICLHKTFIQKLNNKCICKISVQLPKQEKEWYRCTVWHGVFS